ncbi:MAG: response regulator [Anaerolineae bacterium]|nr:response regulator [Anaerolineae bacterium]
MSARILIVDSESHWVSFAQSTLSNFEIVVATDRAAALAALEEDGFDLIIASSRCLDLLEIIKERFADKQVVVMTVQPSPQEALDAYRKGAVRYLPKSFSPNDLLERVTELVVVPAVAG